jgi:hypothetical protein
MFEEPKVKNDINNMPDLVLTPRSVETRTASLTITKWKKFLKSLKVGDFFIIEWSKTRTIQKAAKSAKVLLLIESTEAFSSFARVWKYATEKQRRAIYFKKSVGKKQKLMESQAHQSLKEKYQNFYL